MKNYVKFTDFMNYNKDYLNDFENNDLINKNFLNLIKTALKKRFKNKNQNTDFFKK